MTRRSLPCVLVLAVLAAAPARAQQEPPAIRVTGTGTVSAPPDTGHLTAGVTTEATTASEAMRANQAAMTRVLAALDAAGIAKADVQTSGFSVFPVYADAPQPHAQPQVRGYRVSNQVTVRVPGVDKVGGVLDQLVTAGANEIHGVSFSIGSPEPLRDEARRRALADARRKAELYATTAGVRLGRLLGIAEQEAGPPGPMPRMARMEDAAVPIETGSVELRVDVSVAYAIEP